MLTKYARLLKTKRFDFQVRNVRRTPPVRLSADSPLALVSQLRDQDVAMYLVALKTFARFCAPGRVVLVADGLNARNRALLREHINAVEIREIDDVPTGDCPRGGTWERLLTILDLSAEHYVIQLDADTVTVSDPIAVRECIAANRSFTLGTKLGTHVISVTDASAQARGIDGDHVQVVAERALAQLEDAADLRYVRGNSAFAGFARGAHSRAMAEQLSREMRDLIGARKWAEWGSEQVTSNFVVANAQSPLVLPIEAYSYYHPKREHSSLSFIHFMGTYRFDRGTYARAARQALAALGT
jgi:hypothetical protein